MDVFSTQSNSLKYSNLAFVANVGQWQSEVKYLLKLKNANIWILDHGIKYELYMIENQKHKIKQESIRKSEVLYQEYASANSLIQYTTIASGAYSNFITQSGSYSAPHFNEIIAQNVYQGIDIKYYIENGFFRYDFILHSGANVADIQLIFPEKKLQINTSNKEIEIQTRFGTLAHRELKAYRKINKKNLPVNWKMNRNGIGFQLDKAVYNEEIIIDPLVYASFIGGMVEDEINDVLIDTLGFAYFTGSTSSSTYPTTQGVFDQMYNGGTDAFLTKINTSGSNLVYSTFFGGSGNDEAKAMAFDQTGNVVITGNTSSNNFPITSSTWDNTFDGFLIDVFVLKISNNGSNLLWSTYLGGDGVDEAQGIAIDSLQYIFVVGKTNSVDFPASAIMPGYTYNGAFDGFLAQLNPAGAQLSRFYYLGGVNDDSLKDVAVGLNTVWVAGNSASADFPISANAFNDTYSGANDLVVAAFTISSGAMRYSTYIGGLFNETMAAIAVDETGSLYFIANSDSLSFPVTPGSLDVGFNGKKDVVFGKLNFTGSQMLFASYLGGTGNDEAHALWLDANKFMHIVGSTTSPNFPMTAGAYSNVFSGQADAFIAKINASGNGLIYSTFVGGDSVDIATTCIGDINGNLYIAGSTNSPDFPLSANPFSGNIAGGKDAFFSKFCLGIINSVAASANTPLCKNETLVLTAFPIGATQYSWTGPNNYSNSGRQIAISNANPALNGIYTVTVTNACGSAQVSVSVVVLNIEKPVAQIIANTQYCLNDTIQLITSGASTYAWSGPNAFASTIQNPQIPTVGLANSGTYTLIASNSAACKDTVHIQINVNDLPTAIASSNSPVCEGNTIQLNGLPNAANYQYSWKGPGAFQSPTQNPQLANANFSMTGTYTLTVTDNQTTCKKQAFTNVMVNNCNHVDTYSSNSIEIFPNPSNAVFYVKGNEAFILEVYDAYGKRLLVTTSAMQHQVNLEYYSTGIYFLRTSNQVYRLMKQ